MILIIYIFSNNMESKHGPHYIAVSSWNYNNDLSNISWHLLINYQVVTGNGASKVANSE